ncbi:MAG TPA: peptidase, partial [Bacteroidia bacterium]
MLKKIYFAFFLPAIVVPSVAQTTSSFYLPSNIKSAYEKGTRSPDGSPGKNYWQNSGDYELKIKFDPATRLLDGSEVITYYNNSPDTLHQLLFRLYPNYYKKNELRDQVVRYEDENEGVIIDKLVIGGEEMDTAARAHRVVFNNTNMSVFCKSIFPKQKVKAEVKWHYTLNKGSHQRTGQVDAGAFFIAYCFPRVAVYDDVQGWDESVYMGVNEPYFDFGNFNAEVTVPKDYVVWGTGVLQNPETVLAPNILERYKASLTSDSVSLVVGMEDLAKNAVTAKNAWNTWVFRAEDVPDFSFAISDHYVWQSVSTVVDPSTKRRTVINTAFNPEHTDFFDVNFFSRRTVEVMSNDFPGVPYPYPHITVFDGLDQMEYPMMVNDNPLESKAETVELTDHEIFHTFFPFYMGINQTKYAWMDEG